MLTALQQAKRNGCKIVHVNPLPETGMTRFKHPQEPSSWLGKGTPLADLFLQVRINGDVALLKGMMKEILFQEEDRPGQVLDRDFIELYTAGFAELKAALGTVPGVTSSNRAVCRKTKIDAAAKIFIESERTIFCWAMGLTQHKNAVANIQEIVNLMLLRGQLGSRAPVCVRCAVTATCRAIARWAFGNEPTAAVSRSVWERSSISSRPATTAWIPCNAIHAMHAGQAKVFVALGGNFLSATPDTEFTAEALRRCRLTVQVSTKLNRGHLITGEQALILPCLGRTEIDLQASGAQFVTTENSMAVVQASRGFLPPASPHLLSEPAIVARLAQATFAERTTVDWEYLVADYDRIREHIAAVVPGFDDFNERVRQPGGFYLPNPIREREFRTASGRAHFTVHDLPRHDLASRPILDDDHSQSRSIQHDGLRFGRSLPGHSQWPARRAHESGRHQYCGT